MPSRHARSTWGWYAGGLAAGIGLFGYVVLGWRFGEDDGLVPFAIGLGFVIVAVSWTILKRR